MNNMTWLIKCLDAVFGFEDQNKSTLRKIGHSFDEKNNAHVFVLGYRVRRDDGGIVTKARKNSLLRNILKAG